MDLNKRRVDSVLDSRSKGYRFKSYTLQKKNKFNIYIYIKWKNLLKNLHYRNLIKNF